MIPVRVVVLVFSKNVFEVLLDCLLRESHFVGDFLIGPAFQELLHHRGFACGQVELLLRLGEDRVLPRANPDLAEHDERFVLPQLV